VCILYENTALCAVSIACHTVSACAVSAIPVLPVSNCHMRVLCRKDQTSRLLAVADIVKLLPRQSAR